MERTRAPLGERRLVFFSTALVLLFFLAGFVYLGVGAWRQYRNSIIDNQKEQMLLTTQALSRNMEIFIQDSQSDVEVLALTAQELSDPDRTDGARALLSSYITEHDGSVYDVVVLGPKNQVLYSLWENPVDTIFQQTTHNGQRISQVRLEDGRLCLMLERSLEDGMGLRLLVDLQDYYQKLISDLRLGTNGYVLVKNSNGLILMHPESSQLGIYVIEGREELYPGVDLTSLQQLVDAQNQGGEGVMEYYSYWWMDPDLPRVRKVAAWSPVSLGDDFLVVSAVMDYDDIYVPVAMGIARLALVFLAISLCITALILYLGKLLLDQRKSKAEISDLRELNRQLEELHRGEQAMAHQQRLQIMGTMTGGIAHEFNNLLTPILGHADLMLLDLPEDSELYDSAKEIAQAASHCKEIIRQLSSLSRKNVETVYHPLSIQAVLTRVMKMARSVCPDNITLTVDLALGDAVVLGNETQLNQVILNVCVNAFQAIGQKEGTLRVTGRLVTPEELEPMELAAPSQVWDRYVLLDLADDGCGMTSATLSQIFDPFFTTKKAGQGTGLGLALADQIIRAHKGSITAQSQPGEGSVFHILLPTAREGEEAPPPLSATGKSRFLLVGSNAKVLKLLEHSFRSLEIPVRTATDWSGAMAALEQEPVDVLVADSNLQGDSGLEFCMSFQGKYPALVKLLLVDRPTREVLEAKRRGFIQAWLEKPVSYTAILRVLSQLDSTQS